MEVKATVRDSDGNEAPMDSADGRAIIEGVVRKAMGGDGFWGEVVTGPAEPVVFQAGRKDLLAALTRTQHALATDEDRPVLQSWWLTATDDRLTVHTADNYRLARATVDITAQGVGWFGIHRSEGKALLAFLASGPDSVAFEASGGAWSVHHEDGMLTGRLSPGQPPDWSKVTERGQDETVRYALNGKFASDAARAAIGESGIVHVDYEAADKPTVWHSTGYSEWVMPVRIGADASGADNGSEP